MAPNLPNRYQPQVRLGRDGDIEEWLATDTALDRPVLIRILGAGATEQRKATFLEGARAGASVVHNHLAEVYDVGNHNASPHAVLEWTGGVSIADRLRAGGGIPADEFLPNAAGLAEGLATLHARGVIHGAIDAGAIYFSSAHPAKLGGFGRAPTGTDQRTDTAALAATLRAAVTGTADPGIQPSQVVQGVPTDVDDALDAAVEGRLDAAALASVLHGIPTIGTNSQETGWSWGWVAPAAVLVAAAVLVSIIGLTIESDPDSPFLFPATPSPTQAPPATTTSAAPVTTTLPPQVAGVAVQTLAFSVSVYDPPPGDGSEHDADLIYLTDGDPATSWRTERYFSPLPNLKAGVGIAFVLDESPSGMAFTASNGTRFRIRWASAVPDDPGGWEELTSGSALGVQVEVQLPARDAGVWLLWIVDVPEQEDGVFFAEIGNVTFTG